MKYLLIFLLVLAIFIVSVTLGAQNDQLINFNFLIARGEYRVSTLLGTLFGAGFILGWAICGLFWMRVRLSVLRLERKNRRLEQQLAAELKPVSTLPSATETGN